MTDTTPDGRDPIRSVDELLRPFHDAIKPSSAHRIGTEAEKFGVDARTGAPLPYDGPCSVFAVLQALVERHGWLPQREIEGGPVIALTRANASVTLEPGGQLELSGAPVDDIHLGGLEMSGHLAELRDISSELGIVWLGVGFHPLARQDDLPWVPKARYAIMRDYLPKRGGHGLDMMRRTATVQANFDYASEDDALRKLRVALRISPIVSAIFANSPFYEGRLWGGKSYRANVWLDVDPDRQGLLPRMLEPSSRWMDYVEWALATPMFMFKRGGAVVANTGQTFADFLRNGFSGHRPTHADWEMHLNTLFPEVRLKRTLEVRGADSLPAALSTALPALWTGLLYDAKALDEVEALSASWTHDELCLLRPAIAKDALAARLRGVPLADLAQQILDMSSRGLERRARLSRDGKDERAHLETIGALVNRAWAPADVLLEGLSNDTPGLRATILARSAI